MHTLRSLLPVLLAALSLGLLGGCASSPANPDDPWEGFNRGSFAFNERVDEYVLKPAAQGYEKVTPGPVRAGVSNFFGNLADVWISANNLLQGKPKEAVSDLGRIIVNTTIGVFGLIDVATPMGLEKHNEDFGQTLAVWGVDSGPYIVLPFFGPSNVRDSGGLAVDLYTDVLEEVESVRIRNSLAGLRVVDMRAAFLPAESVLDQAALDKYGYLRSAYLQRRRSLIYDGRPPREEEEFLEE
jgi:phospholipid-binding lipoprotein MlaA